MFDIQSSPAPHRIVTGAGHADSPTAPKQVNSGTLFDGAHELRIDHYGQEYRLRQTRNGKLILTK